MKKISPLLRLLFCLTPLAALTAGSPDPASWRFEVAIDKALGTVAKDGRLFVILAPTNNPEPRIALGRTGLNAPQAVARDLSAFAPGAIAVLDRTAFAFPLTNLSALPAGDYFAQALFDSDTDLRSPQAPGNLYSRPRKVYFDLARGGVGLGIHDVTPARLSETARSLSAWWSR